MRKEIKTELTKEKILAAAMQEFGTNGLCSLIAEQHLPHRNCERTALP
jgi:hypothetical protein